MVVIILGSLGSSSIFSRILLIYTVRVLSFTYSSETSQISARIFSLVKTILGFNTKSNNILYSRAVKNICLLFFNTLEDLTSIETLPRLMMLSYE